MFRILAALAITVTANAVTAQQIPDGVISECNAIRNASKLPECLKEGAIAYEMLGLAITAEFYGSVAKKVVAICREKNELWQGTWVCFETAAEKAVETRELIGLSNIEDPCIAAISAKVVHLALESTYKERRKELFPDEMFYGGTLYKSFDGCL